MICQKISSINDKRLMLLEYIFLNIVFETIKCNSIKNTATGQ